MKHDGKVRVFTEEDSKSAVFRGDVIDTSGKLIDDVEFSYAPEAGIFKHAEYSKTVVITAQPDCSQSAALDKQ